MAMMPRYSLLRPAALVARRAANPPGPGRRAFATKPPSTPNPTTNFYKTFTRPVAKVLLVAVLTYQLVYWSWAKLETDEIRAETDATIKDLESKVEDYKNKVAAETKGK